MIIKELAATRVEALLRCFLPFDEERRFEIVWRHRLGCHLQKRVTDFPPSYLVFRSVKAFRRRRGIQRIL